MNCKYCKMEVPEGYRYCPNCGLLLDLGKQFTAPERKYTIPKYEYQPKKAEAEAAAPETTQQFLRPQHEESTEEAEARLELELRKALERDARALEAEKKPTEAVEFSDEDYARVEQDDTPDAIELEEIQLPETPEEAADTAAETVQEAEGTEEVVEETSASAVSEAAEEAEAPVQAEKEAQAPAETATAVEATAEAAEEIAVPDTAAEAEETADEEKPAEAEETAAKSTEMTESSAESETVAESEKTAEAEPEAAAEAEAADISATEKTAEPEAPVQAEEAAQAPAETATAVEKTTETAEESAVLEESTEPETDTAAEADETAGEKKLAAHAELEERIAALLPDDGLDSTKVDEQGNPAFVWDENISFMEAVSEKSVGDFAVEEDERTAETEAAETSETAEPAEIAETAEVDETPAAVEVPAAETAAAAEAETEAVTEQETAESPAAEAVEEQAVTEPISTEVPAAEEQTAAESEAEALESVPETAVTETAPEAAELPTAEESTHTPEPETEAALESKAADAAEAHADAEAAEATAVLTEDDNRHEEGKSRRRGRRFLIPLALCAVAAGAVVVYLNLPAQRMSRALTKSRNYIESNNFTAAVPVLEKLLQEQPDSLEVHLLLSEAYANTDQHAQAVALLQEAKLTYPDNAELLEKLAELNPTVSVSVPSGEYTDPQSIVLSNEKGCEIHYQLNDEPEQTYDEAILLSTNGDFTLSAYAVASDGAKGETVSMDYRIQLDPEKYPLDQFVDTAAGRQYIDADGAVQTGWMTKGGKTYYFDEKGCMLTGLQTIDNVTYFFDADGVMSTGWQEQDGKYYFFDEKGQMLTGTWIDNQYYVGEDGAMLTDTTTPDGVYVNARGQRDFDAASEFANYPNSIVEVHVSTKVDKGDYYEVSASVYHQKSDNKPAGEAYDITLKVLKHAKVHYLDNNLPDIIASDAFSFLKEIGMQKIQQDEDGYVTEFSFALGEKRS